MAKNKRKNKKNVQGGEVVMQQPVVDVTVDLSQDPDFVKFLEEIKATEDARTANEPKFVEGPMPTFEEMKANVDKFEIVNGQFVKTTTEGEKEMELRNNVITGIEMLAKKIGLDVAELQLDSLSLQDLADLQDEYAVIVEELEGVSQEKRFKQKLVDYIIHSGGAATMEMSTEELQDMVEAIKKATFKYQCIANIASKAAPIQCSSMIRGEGVMCIKCEQAGIKDIYADDVAALTQTKEEVIVKEEVKAPVVENEPINAKIILKDTGTATAVVAWNVVTKAYATAEDALARIQHLLINEPNLIVGNSKWTGHRNPQANDEVEVAGVRYLFTGSELKMASPAAIPNNTKAEEVKPEPEVQETVSQEELFNLLKQQSELIAHLQDQLNAKAAKVETTEAVTYTKEEVAAAMEEPVEVKAIATQDIQDEEVKAKVEELKAEMVKNGIDMSNQAAVMAYVQAHFAAQQTPSSNDDLLNDKDVLAVITELKDKDILTRNTIFVNFAMKKKNAEESVKKAVDKLEQRFQNDYYKMADYIREVATNKFGKKFDTHGFREGFNYTGDAIVGLGSLAKGILYTTADITSYILKTSGDLTEGAAKVAATPFYALGGADANRKENNKVKQAFGFGTQPTKAQEFEI